MNLEYNPRNFLCLAPARQFQVFFDQRQRLQELDGDGLLSSYSYAGTRCVND